MGHGASTTAAAAAAASSAPPSSRGSDLKENIYLISLSEFLNHDSFPGYANCSKNLIKITDINIERSFIIFISHAWIYHPSQIEDEQQQESKSQGQGQTQSQSQGQAQRLSNKSSKSSHHEHDFDPSSPSSLLLSASSSSSSSFTVDTSTNEKYSLCQVGLQSIHKLLAPHLDCYLWMDSCCTNIFNRSSPIENLEDIVQSSDLIFTPIPTDQTIPLTLHGVDFLSDYPITLWNRSRYAYLNRDICRWEMYLGASLPLSPHAQKEPYLRAGLLQMTKLKKRMHFLYDSNMKRQGMQPFSLPLSSKSFQSLLPRLCYSNRALAAASSAYLLSEKQQTARTLLQKQSQSCSEADSVPVPAPPVVHEKRPMMLGRPLPLIAALEMDSKKTNENACESITGHHLRLLENGDQYEGEWLEGERHGPGTLITTSGAVITGTWSHNSLSGVAHYVSPLGEIYEGHWMKNHWHGQGQLTSANGDIYRGEFHNGSMHGDGELVSSQTGKLYRGQWKKNQRDGYGELITSLHGHDKVKYEGEWSNGVLNGKGVYEKVGVEKYDGEWKDGLWSGYGVHTTFGNETSSSMREGFWEKGKFIE
jgi:hypothetical protein